MARSKIVSENEIVRWYNEGRTYQWMVDEYRRKYDIETVPSMFGNFRRRVGLQRRITRDQNLIPWAVLPQHRGAYDLALLRMEARRRRGQQLTNGDDQRLNKWLQRLKDENVVVHYDPQTEQGFFYVPPRDGIDVDLVRVPEHIESKPAAD